MPGFPLAAIGAGLGLWAKNQQEQQAARERQQMLQLQLQRYQQEMQDRQDKNQASSGILSALAGGGIKPVDPMGGSGVGVPIERGGGQIERSVAPAALAFDAASPPPQQSPSFGSSGEYGVGQPTMPQPKPFPIDLAALDKTPNSFTPMRTPPALAGGNPGIAGTGEPTGPSPYTTGTMPQDTRGAGNAPVAPQLADAAGQPASEDTALPPPAQVSPDFAKQVSPILHKVQSTTPRGEYGQQDMASIVARVKKAMPNASPTAQLMAVEGLQKMMAPEVKREWELYKMQNQQEFRDMLHQEQLKSAEARAKEGGWDVIKQDDGSLVRFNKRTGQVEPVQGIGPGATKLGSGSGQTTASAGREKDVSGEVRRLDEEYAAKNPEATAAEKQRAHFENRKTAEKGLTAAKTSEGRTPSAMHMRKYLELHPDASPEQISRAASGFVRDQSIERNFAGGSGATQMRSLNTVADHLSLMREYAMALQTGDIPRVNQLQQFLSKETGWPEVTNFNVARDIMADEVVRLLTSTGGTEADRAGMQSRFAAASSPDQMHGALEAAERFVAGRFKGLEQNYARNDPSRRREFETEMLTPEARTMFVKYGQQPGGAPAQPAPAQPGQAAPTGPQEGQTATNPQTGAKLIFRGGKWTPTQ